MSLLESPFGPVGRVKGILYHFVSRADDFSLEISKYLGISQMFVLILVGLLGGIAVLVITLVGILISMPAHEKTE